ncbi:MAG: SUMF1/EgtB/PvdO family nonheme iron enzyme [Planctomycetes bacterium]|nr:SUMF1/EgtB/PvdO family nonheme iron enzyme [Planctomycetota bacterium]
MTGMTARICFVGLLAVAMAIPATGLLAARAQSDPAVGFLASATSADSLAPEARAAWQLAGELTSAVLILPAEEAGTFVDHQGRPVTLDRFAVVWHHQGDTAAETGPMYRTETVAALRNHVAAGRGLYLSGAALGMLHTLGIEPARPRRGEGGSDSYVVEIVPADKDHPVFAGMAYEGIFHGGTSIRLTNAGYPAYADFHGSGGPTRGMLLARASSSSENPLVEYELGKGRVVALGWRAPHYGLANNAYRANLERLTGNILGYLGEKEKWRKVVIARSTVAAKARPGVSPGQWESVALAVADLTETFGPRYAKGAEYLDRLKKLKASHDALTGEGDTIDSDALAQLLEITDRFKALRREALLANPLMDFDRLMLVQRGAGNLGLPANWQSNSSLRTTGFDNQIAVLSPVGPDGQLTTLFQPEGGRFVGDVDLHFDAKRMLFSMAGANGRWQLFEMNADGSDLHEMPTINEPDVDNYDACYLPDGRIIFSSTAPFVGVPCVYGSSHVTNLYIRELDGSIRQLTVDQEHNWCPTVTNGGRVLYLRWEYSDLPHSNSRMLFQMNPDGTAQAEYYGSNSFFTNSFFYARPVPGHPTKVAGIATGHHGVARAGRLLILDPALGRREADGMVQEIPGRGKKVAPIIRDNLADGIWPQFLHPFPLGENYYLTSARPTSGSPWGVYLVDVFDNMVLLKELPGYALLEPIPLRSVPTPPLIHDRVDTSRKDAVVYMTDIYRGPGLKGIPRGTVKELRLVSYHFSYRGMGGLLGAIGMDGPWDIKRVLGTVPVESDGSAMFRVPANTPVAVQPLDAEGKSLQLMRSWFTAMPGEVLSCVGCHEQQNTVTPNRRTLAFQRRPSEIAPWYGPARGFSFAREVQPVLDEYCIGCHNGQARDDRPALCDLRGTERITDWTSNIAGHVNPAVGGNFSVAYAQLHRYVRRPGIESDIHLLTPTEFHADSTELVQLLQKGHHNVQLDDEAWDRLVTWIDLNAPFHGTWTEIAGEGAVKHVSARSREMRRLYAGMDDDPEAIPEVSVEPIKPVMPEPLPGPSVVPIQCPDWPLAASEAGRRQAAAGPIEQSIDLGEGVTLQLVRIPAGHFVMGRRDGHPDQRPATAVSIDKPYWMGRFEVTNEQFAQFDATHDSHVEPMHGYQFGIHGYPVDGPRQPAVRLSWTRATAFCRWLSETTGRRFSLPTEAQWEYACRAGTATPLWYGDLDTDFARFANLGDARLSEFALDTFVRVRLVPNPNKYDDWVPKEARFDDGSFVSVDVGRYEANPWGLHDIHGNVWEWTRSSMRPYPYDAADGRNDPTTTGRKVVRGGSWYDRPQRCGSAFRLSYPPYQRVFNVGFRVVMEE